MLDNLSGGRMEIGVGRGGVLEAYFWGQESDVEVNYARYLEVLNILKEGLSHDELTYHGEFYSFEELPMRLRPKQQPYPPFWYMRNVETAAVDGMNTIIVGSLDSFEANVRRYRDLWEQHHGADGRTLHGTAPKIGLVSHLFLADSEKEAIAIAKPAWEDYIWNLETPRRVEAQRRGLTQFLGGMARPKDAPDRGAGREYQSQQQRTGEEAQRRQTPGGLGSDGHGAGFGVIAGTPDSVRPYMDEYVKTGANYFVCSFQWGSLTHEQAMRSLELFVTEVMPRYA